MGAGAQVHRCTGAQRRAWVAPSLWHLRAPALLACGGAIDAPLLQQARALPGNDFEDNVQIACAMNAQLDLIITRNPADFRLSSVPVIEPSDIDMYLGTP